MTAFDPGAATGIAYACFVIAWVLYLACIARSDRYLGRLGAWVLAAGVALWVGGWVWHVAGRGPWPSLAGQDVAWLLVAGTAGTAAGIERIYRVREAPFAVLPAVLAAGAWALFRIAQPWPAASPVEQSGWFVAYWLLAGLGLGALTAIGMLALTVLARRKAPAGGEEPPPPPGYVAHRALGWALVVLSAALLVDALRSWLATGAYWSWSPAQGWLLAAWAGYLALLHLSPGSRWWSAASFAGLALVAVALRALGV